MQNAILILTLAPILAVGCSDAVPGNAQSGAPAASARSKSAPVLPRIETYTPPKLPPAFSNCGEPWDCRQGSPAYRSTTKTEALGIDVCSFIRRELEPTMVPARVRREDVADAIQRYVTSKRTHGLRPWTHPHFVQSLSEDERETLADELTAFIQGNVTSRDCS